LWPAIGADKVLKQVIANPYVVADGAIQPAMGNLAWVALTGRW
jgi:hypothetical protein